MTRAPAYPTSRVGVGPLPLATATPARLAMHRFLRWIIPDRLWPTRDEVATAYWEDEFNKLGHRLNTHPTPAATMRRVVKDADTRAQMARYGVRSRR